jgi:trehalose/maltose transport system permease protein
MNQYRTIMHKTGFAIAISAVVIYAVFPFYYAVITSMKTGTALFRVDYFPLSLNLENYVSLFIQQPFARNILNSVLIATGVVLVSLALSLFAAYALGRIHFRGRGLLLITILSVSMFPQVTVLAGMFELIRALGLYNRPGSMLVSYLIFTLPFTVWVLTTYMRDLPRELEEAAIMDGASPLVIVVRIFMPLMWPAMVTTGLLAFIQAWNEFLFALTFTLTNEQRTVPVAIALLSGGSQYELPWGNIMAASVIVTLPLVALVLFFQQRIVSGLTTGALKG